MAQPEFIVIDTVEEKSTDSGKLYKVITDKSGATYTISDKLESKWSLLEPNVAINLTWDKFTARDNTVKNYIKDFKKCAQEMQERMQQKPASPAKNIKDISIEAQIAVKAVTDMMVSGCVEIPENIKQMTFKWIENALTEATK
jgi:RNAse (barnase) inhibitor barstar